MDFERALALMHQPPVLWALLIANDPKPCLEFAGVFPPIVGQFDHSARPSMPPELASKLVGVVRLRCLEKFLEDLQVAHRFETSVQSQSNLWPAVLTFPNVVRSSSSRAMACAAIPRDIS